MATPAEIALFKTDLGFTGEMPPAVQLYAEGCIESARARLLSDGIVLDTEHSPADLMTLITYAAWLYRKRDTGADMPRMLRQDINDRKAVLTVSASSL